MKKCAKCGAELADNATVCPSCKASVSTLDANVFPDIRAPKYGPDAQARKAEKAAQEKETEEAARQAGIETDPEKIAQKEKEAREQKKTIAALAYTGIFFFMPIISCADKEYGRFHSNQGAIIFIMLLLGAVMNRIFGSTLAGGCVCAAWFGAMLYLIVIGIVRALKGKSVPLPVVGGLTIIKPFSKEEIKADETGKQD